MAAAAVCSGHHRWLIERSKLPAGRRQPFATCCRFCTSRLSVRRRSRGVSTKTDRWQAAARSTTGGRTDHRVALDVVLSGVAAVRRLEGTLPCLEVGLDRPEISHGEARRRWG